MTASRTDTRLLRVALTGGIATGKSTCLRRFAELGAATLDADVVARQVVAPGTPALAAIARRFGPAMLRADGSLDRARLGQIIFRNAEARRDLEAIVHPAVFADVERWFSACAAAGTPPVAIADVPLLYETGQQARFDRIVVAACRPDQQLARLMARDGLAPDEARARIAAQWPIDDKRARADLVIDTSGDPDDTLRHVDLAWQALTG